MKEEFNQKKCFYETLFYRACKGMMLILLATSIITKLNFILNSSVPCGIQTILIMALSALFLWLFNRAEQAKNILLWLSVATALAFVYGIGLCFEPGRHGILIFVFCLLIPVFHHALGQKRDRGAICAACVIGTIFAQFLFFGAQIKTESSIPFIQIFHIRETDLPTVCDLALQNVAFICGFSVLISDAYSFFMENTALFSRNEERAYTVKRRRVLLMMLILLLAWLPFFIIYFPGMLSIDSAIEVRQQLGILPASNHHPMAHQLMIRLGLMAGKLVGSYSAGVGVYSLLQMLLLAAAFAMSVEELRRLGLGSRGAALLLLGYALYIPNAMYSITMWKDVPFAAFALLLTLSFARELQEPPKRRLPLARLLCFLLISLGFCLFRSNGLHAYALGVPFLLLFLNAPRRKWVAAYAATLVLVFGFHQILNMSGVEKVRTAEMLSTPLEQIARVVAYSGGEERNSEEFAILREVLPTLDELDQEYDFRLADMLKDTETFQSEVFDANPLRYARAWLRVGLRHPSTYLEAFLLQGSGYWYPDFDSELFYPGIVWTEAGIQMNTRFESVRLNLHTVIGFLTQYSPLAILFSAGLMIWPILFADGLLFAKSNGDYAAVSFPLLGIWFTTLASPVYNEYRYVYGITVCIPFFMLLSILLPNRRQGTSAIETQKV